MKKLLYILTAIVTIPFLVQAQDYTSSSALSSGLWYKAKITKDGIYRIDFEDLAGIGLNAGNEVAVYSNNFGLLSYYNDDSAPDDLLKTTVYVNRGQDGIFNNGDYILFYGRSTHRWIYDPTANDYYFKRHYYSDTAVYFIKLNEPPLEISLMDNEGSPDYFSDVSDYMDIHEEEENNILRSGREWYQPVPPGTVFSIDLSAGSYIRDEGADTEYDIRVLGRSENQTVMRLYNNDELISSLMIPEVNIYNTSGTYARIVEEHGIMNMTSQDQDISVTFYNNGDANAKAWLDYLILKTKIKNTYLSPDDGFFLIRDKNTVHEGYITEFSIQSGYDDLFIWDITGDNVIREIQKVYSRGEYRFIAKTDSLRTFIAFRLQDAHKPVLENKPVPNQNLHQDEQYDMIILSHPLFSNYAGQLAEIHYTNDSYISKIVSPEEIYNEFSGGIPDISAIRNYIRMVYNRNKGSNKPLSYLILFGDGSFDNKKLPPENPNFIPTYQTQNSNISISSFTSDDFFGLLDEGEGEYEGLLDIGIGRIPVSDTVQAAAILTKIKDYISPEYNGPWRNIIAMVADDEDSNIHMNDSDNLAKIISEAEPSFNIEKIYLDLYKQVTSVNGDSYPDATRAINDRINDGCLILNYAGHGNELGLAHERVLSVENINSWSNKGKYPLFITATCEFSRFEDIDIEAGTGEITQKSSAGELVLLNPEGGAIALMTTTRIVFASHNYNLASKLYENAFSLTPDGKGLTLGEIIRFAKVNTGGENKRNFTLLGDPALRLAYPWHGNIITDSLNGTDVYSFNDTVRALSELTIAGHISDVNGNLAESFNGFIYPKIYDKEYELTTMANDGGLPFSYNTRERVLFRGKAEVTGGRFRISLLIPRDIDYTYGNGKISYYADDGNIDYKGYFDTLTIGGFSNTIITDTTGPVIDLYMNDTLFKDGGITDTDPVLLARLSDPGSINTTGTGIGHDIVAFMDGDIGNSIILNNYYENDLGTYKSGNITYPFYNLDKGEHKLFLKAWDSYNNSSVASLVFFVRDEEGLVLNRLFNYPNPFSSHTNICLEHNRPGSSIEIIINIYGRNGQLVKTIMTTEISDGYRLSPVVWDARDNYGNRVAAGVYLYTVLFKSGEETARITGRMVIL